MSRTGVKAKIEGRVSRQVGSCERRKQEAFEELKGFLVQDEAGGKDEARLYWVSWTIVQGSDSS